MSPARLYTILDLSYVSEADAVSVTASLLAGGADILQLRAKTYDLAIIERVARKLLPLCRAAGVPFILNDHPALASAIGADGVHIGQEDGSFSQARGLLGDGKLIGRSTHSLAQARAALAEGFDYIGFGPLFPTPTKAGRPAIGLQEIATIQRDVGEKIPAFCIGGITPEILPQVLAAGARRVVIVSALLQAENVESATLRIKVTLNAELGNRNAE